MAAAIAGPALIVAAVVLVLRGFAFQGKLSGQNVDTLTFYLPNYCFLGKSLAAGHIPAWNPYTLAGTPFASDPQSGWMYAPVMLLFSALPCQMALGTFIVLNPILAGLGIYWFLRGEGASRAAGTVGGLALSLAVAGSKIVLYLPMAGTLAWSALMLAAACRYFSARRPERRLLWGVATALAWSEVMAAFMTHGTMLGTGVLIAYVVGRVVMDGRGGQPARQTLARAGILVLLLPLAGLAFLVPRVAYLSRTTLSLGYARLQTLPATLLGIHVEPFRVGFSQHNLGWPLVMARPPGAFLGAPAFALSFGAFFSRRRRPLAVALAAFGLVFFALSLHLVAQTVADHAAGLPLADVYIHDPRRFIYALPLVIAALAGLGMEAWQEAPSFRARVLMLGPGVALWGVLPLLLRRGSGPAILLLLDWAAALAVLAVVAIRPGLVWMVPVVLASEVILGAIFGHSLVGGGDPLAQLTPPGLKASAYVLPDPASRVLHLQDDGRVLTYRRPGIDQRYEVDPLSTIFGVEQVEGYNPVQLIRYWVFNRAFSARPPPYNVAWYKAPKPALFDLLQIRWVIASPSVMAPVGLERLAQYGDRVLYEVPTAPGRASVVPAWTVVGGSQQAIRLVSERGFDPSVRVVLETNPGLLPPSGSTAETGGTAVYHSLGRQAATVTVDALAPSIVLVRNVFDPNWHATVDGRRTGILHADYVLQGIPVGPGRHTIALTYGDPWIAYGFALWALVMAALMGLALAFRYRSGGSEPEGGEGP